MKDKKSIAIVMLAAITAGIGIFSIVSNQSKLDAYAKLETERNTIQKERDATRAERVLDEGARGEVRVPRVARRGGGRRRRRR